MSDAHPHAALAVLRGNRSNLPQPTRPVKSLATVTVASGPAGLAFWAVEKISRDLEVSRPASLRTPPPCAQRWRMCLRHKGSDREVAPLTARLPAADTAWRCLPACSDGAS